VVAAAEARLSASWRSAASLQLCLATTRASTEVAAPAERVQGARRQLGKQARPVAM